MHDRPQTAYGGLVLWICLVAVESAPSAEPLPRDALWAQYRGPAHGRAELAGAPGPPLQLKWTIDLWDANGTGTPDDCILFGKSRPWELSPAGLGIAWRMDDEYLYAFEVGFYSSGKQFAVFDRHTGELLAKHSETSSQPLASKHVMSIHDGPGFAEPLVFFGNFYAGHRLYTVSAGGAISRLNIAASNMQGKIVGHACEGPRWLMEGFYLNGGGAAIKDGASYRWGSDLCRWTAGEHQTALRDVSVPCAVWDQGQLVMFVRGGLNGRSPQSVFTWQDYVTLGIRDQAPAVLARRRVTDTANPGREALFEDPADAVRTMTNRARNAVNAMAISVDGRYVYCQERKTATQQQIVRRSLEDFRILGKIAANQLPPVSERSTFGHANVELGLGMAVDSKHFYLHSANSVHALTLDLSRVVWSSEVPPRYLNGHAPFCMNRAIPKNNVQYAARGNENTLAVSGEWLYLTTNTTLQIHSTRSGKELWRFEFDDLPSFLKKAADPSNKKETALLRAKGYPGDVLLSPDAVYVATHSNQSRLYCFEFAGD